MSYSPIDNHVQLKKYVGVLYLNKTNETTYRFSKIGTRFSQSEMYLLYKPVLQYIILWTD